MEIYMKTVDMHCDTVSVILEKRREGQNYELRNNEGHLDLLRMKKSDYLLQNFALFVDVASCRDPWEEVCELYRVYEEELQKNADMIRPVLRYEDIAVNKAKGYLSAMLTVEEGAVCQGETEKLRRLYDMGVRMLTLTWNHPNELGYPNLSNAKGKEAWKACREIREELQQYREEREKGQPEAGDLKEKEQGEPGGLERKKEQSKPGISEREEIRRASDLECRRIQVQKLFEDYFYTPNTTGGLTERGREFVAEMERMGMIVDVSHLSDRGFYDVLECTEKPFVASHSNARRVCRCARNLSDDMIRKLSERGGCMGLNYCADFLEEPVVGWENPGTVGSAVRQVKYITSLGGIEVLGLGSDFDGIDTHRELPGAESMEVLWDALHRAGYTEGELDKIFGENVLRVYRDILK